jgi:transposase
MEINFENYDIYLKPGNTDMRKRCSSLSFLVRTAMDLDPMSRSIFIFCGGTRKRIVALVWDGNGWLELSKRLQCQGTFIWPNSEEEALKVDAADVREMLRGGNPWRRFPSF